MEEIKISVGRRGYEEDVYVLRVDGFIDTITAPEVERTLGTMVDQGKYRLIMDLGGVDYISSAGWGIFISRIKEIRRNGGDLKLVRMSPGVYEVFELLEFDRILRAYDSVEEAEKGFGVAHAEEVPVTSQEGLTSKDIGGQAKKSREETGGQFPEQTKLSLADKIREIVREHPEWGSREIRGELRTARYGRVKLGWWRGRTILKKLGLNSKRKRMEYAKKDRDRDR